MPTEPMISIRGLKKRFGDVTVLRDISLEVGKGEVVALIGPSGSGKSTLLRCVNLLTTPCGGTIQVGAHRFDFDQPGGPRLGDRALAAFRARTGMVFQHFNLFPHMTAAENVMEGMVTVLGRPKAEARARALELLARVGLAERAGTYPDKLSGGQKQRVAIARALAMQPEVMLFDEATSALDPESTQSILALLRDINRRFGLTIVLITHEMRVIRDICDRVLVLEGGRVAEQGAVWQVFGTPRHAATRALLRPLESALPEDLALLLRAEPPASGRYEQLVELRYAGGASESDLPAAAPDLARIASALGGRARLLHAGLDRIQARTQGRLLVAVPSGIALPPVFAAPSPTHAKVLGYVPAYD